MGERGMPRNAETLNNVLKTLKTTKINRMDKGMKLWDKHKGELELTAQLAESVLHCASHQGFTKHSDSKLLLHRGAKRISEELLAEMDEKKVR